ncbi:hypothetical protein [Corynebacterium striatum]|uniref:hypothetical protein n=1 Tax=Corynebacterium striatum TaxID=43770 RepID=UPI002551AAF0|nr:hypothetical protein [Corynebacterium striatum]MDK8809083.1 hypothetical protein [Corynebacterium striatum]
MRNIKDSSTREFVVPAGGGSLGSLLAASLDYEPVVVTRLQELIDSARDAAERLSGAALSSEEKADSSAKAARRFEDAASKYAAAAKVSQDAAKGSEDVAAQSASAADVSAKAAKASQDAAAGSASDAKTSQSAAATFAGNAKKAEDAAKAAQARSEEIASSTSWDGDRLTVNGKTSPSLKGDKGEPGSVENVSWADISGKPDFASTWEQVKNKPATYPPAPHTHTTAQIKGLDDALAGKADKGHRHKVEDVGGLKERLDQQDGAARDVYASIIDVRRKLTVKADESYVKSQIASTRSYVDRAVADGSKIKVVSKLPSYPDSSTVYIVV